MNFHWHIKVTKLILLYMLYFRVSKRVSKHFGIFISLEIISLSQSVKQTLRVGQRPVWTSKCTGDLKTAFVVQQGRHRLAYKTHIVEKLTFNL